MAVCRITATAFAGGSFLSGTLVPRRESAAFGVVNEAGAFPKRVSVAFVAVENFLSVFKFRSLVFCQLLANVSHF